MGLAGATAKLGVWALSIVAPAERPAAAAAAAPPPAAGPPEPTEEREATSRVRGRVLVLGRRTPVPHAQLVPLAGGVAIEADAQGRFSRTLAPGVHRFSIRAPGHDELEVTVELAPGEDLEMEYYLAPSFEAQGYRTVVRTDRAVAVSSTHLGDREIHETPGTLGDPLRVVTNLPGASQVSGFLPYVVVRGAAPGNTGYYLDGTRIPLVFHVAIGPSVIHPAFIEAVDFYPGGAPVRLGRFASGIIEARTRAAARDRVHGEVEVRLTDAGALVQIPLSRPRRPGCTGKRRDCIAGPGRGSLSLAGRYSYTAAILSAVQSQARLAFWDFQARLDHDLPRNARFQTFAYGSFDDLGQRDRDPETGERVTFLRFNFYRIDSRIRQALARGGHASYVLVLGLDETGLSDLRNREWRIAPRINVERATRFDALRVGFGIEQELQFFRVVDEPEDLGAVRTEDLSFLFSDRFVSATGAYLELIVDKGRFEARPGIRADLYVQVGASPYLPEARGLTYAIGVDPRVSFRERVTPRWRLEQAVGVYHQPPTSPIPVPGLESFGFERGLQRNVQGSFGYAVQAIENRLTIEQDVYAGYLTNVQDYEYGEPPENDPLNEIEDAISTTRGWTYGLETMVRLDPRMRVFGWAAYTLSRSMRLFELTGRAPSNWDQTHILNVVLGYRIGRAWNVGARLHYNSGRPYTARPVDTAVVDAERNNARLPAFLQVDLRVGYTKVWPRWQLELYLDVANATYSREIFQCVEDAGEADFLAYRRALALQANMDQAIVACTPLGFRYVIPALGIKGRW